MKYSLSQLDLNVWLKDLVIDSESTDMIDIINEVTQTISKTLSKFTDKSVDIGVEYVKDLFFDESEESKKVHITNIQYDLYDEEEEERKVPREVVLSLEDVNKSTPLDVDMDFAIRIALNDYMIDHNYAKVGEQIVYDCDYEFIK